MQRWSLQKDWSALKRRGAAQGAARRISESFAEAAELRGSPPSVREFVDAVGLAMVGL